MIVKEAVVVGLLRGFASSVQVRLDGGGRELASRSLGEVRLKNRQLVADLISLRDERFVKVIEGIR